MGGRAEGLTCSLKNGPSEDKREGYLRCESFYDKVPNFLNGPADKIFSVLCFVFSTSWH